MTDKRYTLGEPIGAGAMGDVYKATDTQTGQTVAVKQLKAELVQRDPSALKRFIREGQALRQLDHPNIVKMLDSYSAGKRHTIVMEYVDGGDLATLLEEQGRLPIKQALQIGLQLADALTRSHFLKIIHRDIKPVNVLMTADGTPKLTDFGIAQMAQSEEQAGGMIIGTYAYLSPEACMSLPLDERADIWAFGVVLYEMLTGRLPFEGDTPGTVMINILNMPLVDPQSLRPELPDALNDLLYRILTKQREARIPSIRLVGAELEGMLKGVKVTPTQPSPVRSKSSRFATATGERPAHNLPHQTTPFVGRTTELAEVQRLLDAPDTRLVTLHGPGGMGKTRLAVEAARTRLDKYVSGVYFVELAPLSDPATIPNAIAEATDYRFTEGAAPADQIVNFLANKHMLLIMDNFEHVLAGRDLVTRILKAAPNVTMIVTSRERLSMTGESVFTLGGMDFPAWETPADAMNYSAVKLFMQAAKRAKVDFSLDPADLDHLARICRLVQGTPLGIILAAGWADTLPLKDIATEIAESTDFLASQLSDLPDRQRSIRAAFEYSWKLLSEEEQAAFSRVAVFRGSCTYQAAKKVTAANLRMLSTLANKSLLRRNPTSGRFEVHELLRQFAAEHLEETGEADDIRQAHATYYLTSLADREHQLKGSDQLAAVEDVEVDFENVRAAWLWAVENDRADLLQPALMALRVFCTIRSRFTDAFSLLEAVRDHYAGKADQRLTWAEALLHREIVGRSPDEARKGDFKTALKLARDADNRRLECTAHQALGWLAITEEDYPQALEYFQQALKTAEATGDVYAQAASYHRIGFTHIRSGNIPAGAQATQKAAELRRAHGDLSGLSSVVNNLGTLASYSRDYKATGAYYEEAMTLAQQLGNLGLQALVASNLAFHYVRENKLDKARAFAEETIQLAQRINAPNFEDQASIPLTALALRHGNYALVEQLAIKQMARPSTDPQVMLAMVTMRSLAASGRGEFEAAKAHLRPAAPLIPEANAPLKSTVLWALVPIAAHAGDEKRAVELLRLQYQHTMMAAPDNEFAKPLLDLRKKLKGSLGEKAYKAAWERGAGLDIHAEYTRAVADYL